MHSLRFSAPNRPRSSHKIGKPLGVSDTDAGITVTADAILGDEHNLNVVFTLTKDDGSSWDVTDAKTLSFGEATVRLNHLGGSHGGAWFVDEDPNDNQLQYVEQITVDDGSIPDGVCQGEHVRPDRVR